MANSKLDIRPGTFTPPAISPEMLIPEGMTAEEWYRMMDRMLAQLRDSEIPEEWRSVVPPAPNGGLSLSGESSQPKSPTMGGGSLPPLPSGQMPASPGSFGLPGQITAGAASEGIASGATGGGGLTGWLKGLLNPSNAMDLAGAVTGVVGALKGGGGQSSADAQRLNAITEQRMRRVDPLHQAVTQLAWGRLPTNARQGIAPPTYQPLP